MKSFLGLFAHWDVIVRQEPPPFLGKFFTRKSDSEYHIAKKLHDRISSSLVNPRRVMGGNAGNAAVTLSELGIVSVLSCPARPKAFVSLLSKHRIFLMSGGKETPPLKCARPDEDPEHIVFEMEGYRKIFNYNPVQKKFLLDYDFWDSLKNASYLFLCGFHNVPERHRKKVNEIADFLEKRKFKAHLELGCGKGSLMKYAVKRLLDRNCMDSLGMNETELNVLGIRSQGPRETAQSLLLFMAEKGIERISLHARDYRITAFRKDLERNTKAAEFSIQACAAKALGGIKENMEKAKKLPRSGVAPSKGENFFIIPTLIAENPKIIVGMGDTASVTDSYFALKNSLK